MKAGVSGYQWREIFNEIPVMLSHYDNAIKLSMQ
jgi:hypothetical protein